MNINLTITPIVSLIAPRHSHLGCASFSKFHCRNLFNCHRADWIVWHRPYYSM